MYKELKNKKCFIFPYSASSNILKTELEQNNVIILGFIDNKIQNSNILLLNEAIKQNFDYIIIYSDNHLVEIYKQTVQVVDKHKILSATLSSQNNFILNNTYKVLQIKDEKEQKINNYFLQKQKEYTLSNSILLIGIGFIDINIKYLYEYIKKYTKYNVYLATNNKRDIEKFNEYNIKVVEYYSKDFIDLVFQCKIKIVDHSPVEPMLVKVLQIGCVIQLWHGVTVKMLGTQVDYKIIDYDIVLSTSQFVTDYSFSKLYNYKHIIHCGYPRNDILRFDDIELINVDLKLLNQMQNDSNKYIIYMPTYRPLGFENNPFDYKRLNEFGKKHNIKFIIKMHPFIGEKIRDDLNSHKHFDYSFTHLIIYDASMDIYPLLKYSDMLIADYSSVYFDYLFVDKPIVFFPYDYEAWQESADGTMLDYFSYTPGDIYYDFDKLLEGILKNLDNDQYKLDRKNLLNKMFINQTYKSSQLIIQKIEELLFDI